MLTVSPVVALTLPELAEMVVVPSDTPVANPEVLMVATLVDEEAHVTWFVASPVELFPYVAVAVK